MKKILLALGTVVLLTACGGGDDAVPAPEEEAVVDEPATEEATGDFDATAARESYEASCIHCHGNNLQGGGGPGLAGGELTAEEIFEVIQNGQGTMPPQNLPSEDAENLAQWIAAQ
ncbi:c-type cytochrome [Halalkalibacter kiskunsagensis]|uniref:C-type cytochrome n=1 Tax=Halalkalibacter kiskunsagensis TaxID=1548599 RepID=A0ABV6K9F0_9BACI